MKKSACSNHTIRIDKLEDAVLTVIQNMIDDGVGVAIVAAYFIYVLIWQHNDPYGWRWFPISLYFSELLNADLARDETETI